MADGLNVLGRSQVASTVGPIPHYEFQMLEILFKDGERVTQITGPKLEKPIYLIGSFGDAMVVTLALHDQSSWIGREG